MQNFESHKASVFTFAPGVNVIAGESDAGKSAVLRALLWVIKNTPGGDSIRSWGAKEPTIVAIKVDGHTITKTRDKKGTTYNLDGEIYRAVGKGVPQRISSLLNINDINTQFQFDSPFLLGNDCSPGDVAQHFNEVAHLDLITKSASNINKWTLAKEAELKNKQAQYKELYGSLAKFSDIDALEADMLGIEELCRKEKTLRASSARLDVAIAEIGTTEENIKKYSKLLQLEGSVDEVLGLVDFKMEIEMQRDDLCSDIDQIITAERSIKRLSPLLGLENDVEAGMGLLQVKADIEGNMSRLHWLVQTIKRNGKEICKANATIQDLTSQLPKVCPTCGQPMKEVCDAS
jgi:hypothetical protein